MRISRTLVASIISALIAATVVAWAAQTNYLGTVFIADTTTPANQLKVQSDGSISVGVPVYGAQQTAVTSSSASVANASAVATLAAVVGKTNYLTGFQCTASGATAASVVTATVTGAIGGTMNYTFTAPAGVTTAATPLIASFPVPVPANATNTAIVVTMPALGAGNTNATCAAQGFYQ